MKFEPLYYKDKLKIINEEGSVGIITLWTKPQIVENIIREKCPQLLNADSEIVTISSLYGNGFSQMMANLANNPQIDKLLVIGNDTLAIKSYDYINNFLNLGVKEVEIGNVKMLKIIGTNLLIDYNLDPKIFSYLKLKRIKEDEIEQALEFVKSNKREVKEEHRIKIKLEKNKFPDFPSDITNHNITAKTPLDAWLEVLYHLEKFGKNIQITKGVRRALFNLDVNIQDPSFEDEIKLKEFGFSPEEIRLYQEEILNPELLPSLTYSYGNRIRKYWGDDTLTKIGIMLKEDPKSRHCFISLWDTSKDLIKRESSPCLTDLYFVKETDGTLMLSASFRTHNALSAWLLNVYGLRAIQEKVANDAGLKPGRIHVRSRWIGIDLEDPKTKSLLGLVKEKRNIKIDVNDPKGYFIIEADKDESKIIVYHYSPEGILIEEIKGQTISDIKNQMRQKDAFSTYDHAMFFGIELARAQKELTGDIPVL